MKFFVPVFEPLPPQYFIRVVADRWIGKSLLFSFDVHTEIVIFGDAIISTKTGCGYASLHTLPLHIDANNSFHIC